MAIAVRNANPRATDTLPVFGHGGVDVTHFATSVLGLRAGESFQLETTIDEGHAIGILPKELVQRMRGLVEAA